MRLLFLVNPFSIIRFTGLGLYGKTPHAVMHGTKSSYGSASRILYGSLGRYRQTKYIGNFYSYYRFKIIYQFASFREETQSNSRRTTACGRSCWLFGSGCIGG